MYFWTYEQDPRFAKYLAFQFWEKRKALQKSNEPCKVVFAEYSGTRADEDVIDLVDPLRVELLRELVRQALAELRKTADYEGSSEGRRFKRRLKVVSRTCDLFVATLGEMLQVSPAAVVTWLPTTLSQDDTLLAEFWGRAAEVMIVRSAERLTVERVEAGECSYE